MLSKFSQGLLSDLSKLATVTYTTVQIDTDRQTLRPYTGNNHRQIARLEDGLTRNNMRLNSEPGVSVHI